MTYTNLLLISYEPKFKVTLLSVKQPTLYSLDCQFELTLRRRDSILVCCTTKSVFRNKHCCFHLLAAFSALKNMIVACNGVLCPFPYFLFIIQIYVILLKYNGVHNNNGTPRCMLQKLLFIRWLTLLSVINFGKDAEQALPTVNWKGTED